MSASYPQLPSFVTIHPNTRVFSHHVAVDGLFDIDALGPLRSLLETGYTGYGVRTADINWVCIYLDGIPVDGGGAISLPQGELVLR